MSYCRDASAANVCSKRPAGVDSICGILENLSSRALSLDEFYRPKALILERWADANEKTAIDINQRAISLVEAAAAQLNKKVNTLVCDMFAMPFCDAGFDIVFNAGVIEHFSAEERARALSEYSRIMKDDGLMIIAFPNHHCPPYRFAYLTMRLLGVWRFPSEYKIYDLGEESQRCGLRVSQRLTLSRGTIFNWLNFLPPAKALFRLLDRLFHYEGYLTVVILSKSRA